jgi:transposase
VKKRGPKAFTAEFRREAVRLADSGTAPIAQIARELGIHVETLRGWRRRANADQDGDVAPTTPSALEAENRRLRRELAVLREERDILKKATAFFAKDAR